LRILVTGASGFVGSALCPLLEARGHAVRRAIRASGSLPGAGETVSVGELSGETDWTGALAGVQCVVHLAARTHVLRERSLDPLAEYRRVNVEATRRLAAQAAAAGARRLVFASSVKVNGEESPGRPFTEADDPRPQDAYGLSKREAEQALRALERETGLEVVVLRPPLVYGPGVKGNFLRLLQLVARGVPLPLASVRNRRSLIYVGNLADAILAACEAPQAAGRTYLVSDGEPVSTPELVRAIARALGVAPRLLPCPPALLRAAAALAGRGQEAHRLLGSLEVDGSRIARELGWRPRASLAEGLAQTARWFGGARTSGANEGAEL
jgi:nucleoside-diphosphate-sugar epimerase